MYTFRVSAIHFADNQVMSPSHITVLVGPNNSGKSTALLELLRVLTTASRPKRAKVISVAEIELPGAPSDIEATYGLTTNDAELWEMNPRMRGHHGRRIKGAVRAAVSEWLRLPPDEAERKLAQEIGWASVLYLNTATRLSLASSKSDFVGMAANNILQEFDEAYNRDLFGAIQDYVDKAFGLKLQLEHRVRRRRGWRHRLVSLMAERSDIGRKPIEDFGDGLCNFVAVALALAAPRRSVVLVDEPEAFLHPPQATRLGELIAEYAGPDKQVFVATHSANLLRGMLQRGRDLAIVRLGPAVNGSNITLIKPSEVQLVVQTPLLSSSRVLEGVFSQAAVVVEADSDQAFYQKVAAQVRPGEDIQYVSVPGKQAISKVLDLYRSLGIRTAAITDFDILRTRKEFQSLLAAMTAGNVHDALLMRDEIHAEIDGTGDAERLLRLRDGMVDLLATWPTIPSDVAVSQIKRKLKTIIRESDKWAAAKKTGRAALSRSTRKVFDELDTYCRDCGLFIVPVGELESMLVGHGYRHNDEKAVWIAGALDFLESLTPDTGKLPWSFVAAVHEGLLGAHLKKAPAAPCSS